MAFSHLPSFQNYDLTQLNCILKTRGETSRDRYMLVRSLTRFGESDPVRRSPHDVVIRWVNGAFLAQIALPLVEVGLKRPRHVHLRETDVAAADKNDRANVPARGSRATDSSPAFVAIDFTRVARYKNVNGMHGRRRGSALIGRTDLMKAPSALPKRLIIPILLPVRESLGPLSTAELLGRLSRKSARYSLFKSYHRQISLLNNMANVLENCFPCHWNVFFFYARRLYLSVSLSCEFSKSTQTFTASDIL